jgi:WD40 repeat protein
VATGSLDGTVKLWDVASGNELATLKGHKSWVNSVAFTADGTLLATGSSDGTVKLWDVATRREQATLKVPTGEVRSVAFAPNGKVLAAGIRYGTVKVWDVVTRKELASIKGHASDVWTVAFAPDGKTLASGDGDWNQPGDVRLWDTARWGERAALKHTGEVLCLAFTPDGKSLAAGSWDKTIKVWDVSRLAAEAGRARSTPRHPVPWKAGAAREAVAGPAAAPSRLARLAGEVWPEPRRTVSSCRRSSRGPSPLAAGGSAAGPRPGTPHLYPRPSRTGCRRG